MTRAEAGGIPDGTGTAGATGAAPPGQPFATALDAASGPAGSPGSPATATPPPVADQVARHLAAFRILRDGTQHTVLHLNPEHLGALTLAVDVHSGTVRLSVSGSEAALAALREGLGDLAGQLDDAGLELGDVTLRQESTDSGRGQSRGEQAANAFAFAAGGDGGASRRGAGRSPGESAGGRPAGSGRDSRAGAAVTGSPGAGGVTGPAGSLDVLA